MRNDAGTQCYGDAARRAACRKKAFDPFDRLPGTMPGTDRAGRLRDSGRQ